MKRTILLTVVSTFLLIPAVATATLYNVQLNGFESYTYSGAAHIGSDGDVWNNPDWAGIAGSTTLFSGVTLVDSTGADNGVLATMTSLFNTNTAAWNDGSFSRYSGQTGGSATSGLMDMVVKSDYDYANGIVNTHTLTITGLAANSAVTVYVYGAGNSSSTGGVWSLDAVNGGDSATIKYDGSPTGLDVTLAGSQGLSWEALSGTTDALGNLTIVATGGNGGTWWQTYMNGIQIDVVPEPATMLLLALGGLTLRKRK